MLVARIISMVAAVAVLAGVGIAWVVTDSIQGNSGTSSATANAGGGGVISEGGMTILLVGSDSRTDADGNPLSAEELKQVATEDDGGGINTDTMMLVHVPQGGGKATAVSLPRDTWISTSVTEKITGPYPNGTQGEYAPNKINSFYATAKAYTEEALVNEGVTDVAERERTSNEAGRTMLVKVVQAFTGMKVDHYAEVNLLGFYLLSQAIGGVPVCLNNAVNDPWSGANFAAGPQEVSGTAALSFVRQRHGLPNGDLDRVKRQQAFLAGAVDRILSIGTLTNPTRLNDLVSAVDRTVVFDKDFSVLSFADQMTNLSAGNVTFATLPTRGAESSTNKDALATDPAEVAAFFAGIANPAPAGSAAGPTSAAAPSSVDPATVTVDIQDGTVADGVTARASSLVRQGGFVLGRVGVVPGTKEGSETAATKVQYPAGMESAAAAVQRALGVGTTEQSSKVAAGHVEVVVGTDLPLDGTGPQTPAAAPPAAAPPSPAGAAPPAPAPDPTSGSSVPCVN